jgi:hypothetical protein
MAIPQRKYSPMQGQTFTVPWPPTTGDPEWDKALSLLCAPHCLIEGDLYDQSESLKLQGYVSVAVHWLYRKRWKSGHRLTECPKLWRGLEPLGDLLLAILKLAEEVFEASQTPGFPQFSPPDHPAEIFQQAAVQMMLIVLVSCEGKRNKSDLIRELRALTETLRNKPSDGENGEPENPFSKKHDLYL